MLAGTNPRGWRVSISQTLWGCRSPQPPTRDRDGVRDRVWDHLPIPIPIPMAQRKAVPAAARAPSQLPNRDVGDPKPGPGGGPGAAQPPPDPLPPSGTDLLRGAARRLRCFLLAAAEGPGAERLPLRGWSRGGAAGASPEL